MSLMQIPAIIHEKGGKEVVLWAELHDEKFAGRLWAATSEELAKYCYPILLKWISSGRMLREVKRAGRQVGGFGGRSASKQDVADLAGMTIARALDLFRRKALAGDGWQPERQACMATYLVGACRLTYSNCLREMISQKNTMEEPAGSTPPGADFLTVDGPERLTALRDLIEELDISGEQAKIAELTAYGFTQAEIAGARDTTTKAVEGMIHRLRKRFRMRGIS